MSAGDQRIRFNFGKYAGCSIGFEWRRMDEGRVLWWYPASKKADKLCEPTRSLPNDVHELAKQYSKMKNYAGMTICEFIVAMFNGQGTYENPND